MQTIDVPQSASLYRYMEKKDIQGRSQVSWMQWHRATHFLGQEKVKFRITMKNSGAKEDVQK